VPITNGRLGLEVVKILEAASESLRQQGASVNLGGISPWNNGCQNGHVNGHAENKDKSNGKGHAVPLVITAGQAAVAA
jgi:hypothetical protein